MIKKAIIPAAGIGTRSLPITKVIPKEMFPIGLKPAIEYIVDEAISSGIEQILIIVSRSKNLIVDYFDHSFELEMFLEHANKSALLSKLKLPDIQILYTRQPFARGLGDAIRIGKNFVGNDPFAVLLPDDIIISQKGGGLSELIEVYEKNKSTVIGLTKVEKDRLADYGVVKGQLVENALYKILDIVEKPQKNPPSNLAVTGRYVFSSDIMPILENLEPDIGGEIQLTDAIKLLLKRKICYGKLISGERYDIGKEIDYLALLNYVYKDYDN
ncbi:UTP--glucose-1-phosphate uridylyltransferase [Bacillus sp. CECT 9360]|uniref:UTP--glucose-1-phosphate uridylyltransferase n=1 Tax=Bacillus sp. CECT 9360 TaxID=2845821 RepID=UPI001E399D58|nr:UTP--glucose-1-phosphate uridylyltransferase [Bacillus sp. CECT 9360]CAH0345488.1 UTP--glucose-1-phosphate uridylyltransferase [Bacillus sp. CECT 9360]